MIVLWAFLALIIVSFGLIILRGAPYVPTHRRQLDGAFDELYSLGAEDTLVDLGSGDGVVLDSAAKRGAAVIGYELNPFLIIFSRLRLHSYKNVRVLPRDFLFISSLPDTVTVVYAFTTAHSIEGIGRKMSEWSTGREIAFISYGFMLKNVPLVRSTGAMHLYCFKDGKIKT